MSKKTAAIILAISLSTASFQSFATGGSKQKPPAEQSRAVWYELFFDMRWFG